MTESGIPNAVSDGQRLGFTAPQSAMLGWLAFFDGLTDPLLLIDFQTGSSFANRTLCEIVGERCQLRTKSSRASDVPSWVHVEDRELWQQTLADTPRSATDGVSTIALSVLTSEQRKVRMKATTQWLWDADRLAGVVVLLSMSEPALSLASYNGQLTPTRHDQPELAELLLRVQSALRDARVPVPSTGTTKRLQRIEDLPLLSARERQVLDFLVEGKRVLTVAETMGLSENTIRNYMKRIYRKFKVSSEAELRELLGNRLAPGS